MKIKYSYSPLVSIIIPVYNGANYLEESIECAINQTYNKIEIIVVNDGSTDNSENIALSYGDKIKYYKKQNGGQSSAYNYGIDIMSGEYFALLGHDDMFLPTKIENDIKLINENIEDKDIIIPYCLTNDIDFEGKEMHTIRKKVDMDNIKEEILTLHMQCVCTMLIPKSAFVLSGNFNENRPHTSDAELLFNLADHYKFICTDEVSFLGRVHPGQMTYSRLKYHLSECSLMFIDLLDKIYKGDKDKIINDNDKLISFALLWSKGGYVGAYNYLIKEYLPVCKKFNKFILQLKCLYYTSKRKIIISIFGLRVAGRKLV